MGAYSGKNPHNRSRASSSPEMPVVADRSQKARGPESARSVAMDTRLKDSNYGRNRGVRFDDMDANQAYHANDTKMGDEPTHPTITGEIVNPSQV